MALCWDSDLDWSRLENQFKSMEAGLQGPESGGPVLCQESWTARWHSSPAGAQSRDPDPVYPEFDNPLNTIRR